MIDRAKQEQEESKNIDHNDTTIDQPNEIVWDIQESLVDLMVRLFISKCKKLNNLVCYIVTEHHIVNFADIVNRDNMEYKSRSVAKTLLTKLVVLTKQKE